MSKVDINIFAFFSLLVPAEVAGLIDIEGAKIDCLSLFMCPLLAQLKIGFFSSFSDAAVYSTNEANKAGLKQSIIFRCLWLDSNPQPGDVEASVLPLCHFPFPT